MRSLFLLPLLISAFGLRAQTYFYIDEILVLDTSDSVSIQLTGRSSDTGAHFEFVHAGVSKNMVEFTIIARSNGGDDVLVPHTETIELGTLPAGIYQVSIGKDSEGVKLMTGPDPLRFTVVDN